MKALVLVLHRDRSVCGALRRGLPRRWNRVVGCRGPEDVARRLASGLVDAVVVDVLTPLWADTAFALRRQYPRIPVFASSAFRPDDGRLLLACRAAGVRGLLVDGLDTPVAGELVGARTASRERRQALAGGPQLLRLTEPLQLAAWHEVLLRAGGPMSTTDVAAALGHTREHVSREFGAGGAPNLKRVIDLVRVAWAADLLANPAYGVRQVAAILGYSSTAHLAASARRVAGAGAAELGPLGATGVLQRFRRGRTRSRV